MDAAAAARVAVVERRGKFLVAEPFFYSSPPTPRVVVSRDSRFSVGDLVVLRPPASGGRRGGGGRGGGGGGGGGGVGPSSRGGSAGPTSLVT